MPTPADAPYKVQQRDLKKRLEQATRQRPVFPFEQRVNPARASRNAVKAGFGGARQVKRARSEPKRAAKALHAYTGSN